MANDEEIKNVAAFYDKRAENTDGLRAAGQWKSTEDVKMVCEEICRKIDIKSSDRILEIGCGSGVLGSWLEERCELYVGFDVSFQMLKKFKGEHNKSYNLVQSVTHLIPFCDKFFDKIVMNGVTMYIHDVSVLENTLNEIDRVAKNTATVFLGENITPDGYYWELVWFQNLSRPMQFFAKPYIRLRKMLASKSKRFEGKWKSMHKEIEPLFIKNHYKNSTVEITDASARKVRERALGSRYRGNRRIDFVIKLGSRNV